MFQWPPERTLLLLTHYDQRHKAPQVGDQVLNNDCYVISFSVHCTEEGDRRVPTLQALKQENLPFLWCPG